VKTVSGKVVRHSLANKPCKNYWWGWPEILDQTDHAGTKLPIFYLFARSDSAVTPSEKLQLTLTGSLLRAFQ